MTSNQTHRRPSATDESSRALQRERFPPPDTFRRRLLDWFDRFGRHDLPWQINSSPYRVWVSEIMLQQTQVATVIPYFERFVSRFPDVQPLASAAVDEVLALWSGLGYYARGRNLHRTAGLICSRHGGEIPRTILELTDLPGIGRSTAGAILSMGYETPSPILDGNVKRVLCRVGGLEGWPGDTALTATLWDIATQLTALERVRDYGQAIMDIGATVCRPARPLCDVCPFHHDCQAQLHRKTDRIPGRKPLRSLPVRRRIMLVASDESGALYLEQNPYRGLWGGLWSFPLFEDEAGLADWTGGSGISIHGLERLDERRHTFSHFHLDYIPLMATVRGPRTVGETTKRGQWFSREALTEIGLPSPVKRLIDSLFGHDNTQQPSP